ncbi:helix-turn-helix domain-containing protein [Desulfoluna spongiiphila]|uniref:helix-turn-helix domain-containing protein n=1 Tax=Desulfoluna spongiiphila TaxID=419481 RepID=UPI0012597F85|nr:helix-turn-helix transcriptional regulator [Desulfoluna spongiiphila]VVS95335.1 cro/c1-type helix-turn-helix domain [Desulfoluna spongiiphila]
MVNILDELSLEEIGARIKSIRESRHMTMAALGMALGRPTDNAGASLIKNLEAGRRKRLKENELEKILNYLELSKTDFINILPLDKSRHTDIHPLYKAVPGIEEFVDALGLAQRMEDTVMEKMVLGHIKDQIDKIISK